jgi:hypothetical protein
MWFLRGTSVESLYQDHSLNKLRIVRRDETLAIKTFREEVWLEVTWLSVAAGVWKIVWGLGFCINAGAVTTNFGSYSYPRTWLSRLQAGKSNFVITDSLVTERSRKNGVISGLRLCSSRKKGHSFKNSLQWLDVLSGTIHNNRIRMFSTINTSPAVV